MTGAVHCVSWDSGGRSPGPVFAYMVLCLKSINHAFGVLKSNSQMSNSSNKTASEKDARKLGQWLRKWLTGIKCFYNKPEFLSLNPQLC